MPAAWVTPEYLLKGAAYALEQCGLLLRDANLLYRNGSYANAVVLAAFAREALGQWEILRKLRKQVLAGGTITIKDIQDACRDHVDRQRAGALSTGMMADNDTQLGKLIRTVMFATPGSEGWKTAHEQMDQMRRRKEKRVPQDRHKQREVALYVDPVAGGWNRPTKEISQASAMDFLSEAGIDYSMAYDSYANPDISTKHDDPELYCALIAWTDRPKLPKRKWPMPK
jgi:AbiV family abortive infection protein